MRGAVISFLALRSFSLIDHSKPPNGTPRTVVTPWPNQSLYTYSASGFCSSVGMSSPLAHSPRFARGSPHGFPARSMFVIARCASAGALPSISVR